VEQRVSRHSRKLLDLAKQNDWERLRKELIVTQEDVEKALLELRDEPIVHLLSLGGWIRGLQIAAASVAANYSLERAKTLRNLELLDYYLDRLNTLSPRLKRSELVQKITAQLETVRTIFNDNEVLSPPQVNSIQAAATSMVDLIEK
jgi:Rps23 Pro-64 3,4-dihydroxylase Tpa1-like proline 4-hydroxylase